MHLISDGMRKQWMVVVFIWWFNTLNAQLTDSLVRRVDLEGTVNFRDMGGYINKEGKKIKWKKLFRSDALNKLSGNDTRRLQSYSIKYVFDFRGPAEFKSAPDILPVGATWVSLPAGSENIGSNDYIKSMQNPDSFMLTFYGNLKPFKERYRPFFDTLLVADTSAAIIFHCTAGKDRTGIAAALLLSALNVDEQLIFDDYLATNYYREQENKRIITVMTSRYNLDKLKAEKLLRADRLYLKATFDAIKLSYGSVANYLDKELGLTKEKLVLLKSRYLE